MWCCYRDSRFRDGEDTVCGYPPSYLDLPSDLSEVFNYRESSLAKPSPHECTPVSSKELQLSSKTKDCGVYSQDLEPHTATRLC